MRKIALSAGMLISFFGAGAQTEHHIPTLKPGGSGEPEGLLRGTGYSYEPSFLKVTGAGAFPDTTGGVICDCDGTGETDATDCLQDYLDSAYQAGKPLLIPETDQYYRISRSLVVNGSVLGHGGMPKIVQTSQENHRSGLDLENGMSGWIYNLHIVGPYDSTASTPATEWGHNIGIRAAQYVTIMNCVLETALGDGIGTASADGKSYNILITNNDIIDSYRNGIATTNIDDHWAIMNNRIEYYSRYVNPIDFEPWQETSLNTNMEVGYNEIISPKPEWSDESHFYSCVVKLAGYFDQTPGENFFLHHNWGDWGVTFHKVNPHENGTVYWKNVEAFMNVEGNALPGPETGAVTTPSGLSHAPLSMTSFELTWKASAAEAGVKGYLVYQNDSLLGITGGTSYEVRGLDCGSNYEMTVKAYDNEGNTSHSSVPVQAAPVDCSGGLNMLVNPGFESVIDIGWDQDLGGGFDRTDTISRNGMYSLPVGPGSGGRAQILTGAHPDSSYTIQVWSRSYGSTQGSSFFGVEIRDSSDRRIFRDTVIFSPGSTGWTKNFLNFSVPSGTAKTEIFVYQDDGSHENVIVTDDWSVVPAIPVTGIEMNQTALSVPVGLVTKLEAVIHPAMAVIREVRWSTSDSSVAAVSQDGLIWTYAEGNATITAASIEGGMQATCDITVTGPVQIPLVNPGIEDGFHSGWTKDWGGTTAVITDDVHSGSKAMSLGPGEGGRAQQIDALEPEATYTLSAFAKLTGTPVDTSNSYLGIDFRNASGGRLYITPSVYVTDSMQWKQYHVTFKVPKEAAANDVFLYQQGSSNQTVVLADDWGLMSGWEPLEFFPVHLDRKQPRAVRVYPNPLTGKTLHLEGLEGEGTLFLYDMTGRIILVQKLRGVEREIIRLEQQLLPGIYYIKIAGRSGTVTSLSLIAGPP